MKYTFSETYKAQKKQICDIISNFETEGTKFDERKRNSLKLFELDGKTINVKSFKVPNLVNRIAYKTFRSSKAVRSFEYAHELLKRGVLTPQPIAFFEEEDALFGRSFYVSEHLDYDLTYRELCHESAFIGNEEILSAFARFTFELHEKGIHFLDHSPGNTLIVIKDDSYDFYLVDLNRMKFGVMDFSTRMQNFERLSHRPEDIAIMATAYAAASGEDSEVVRKAIEEAVTTFQEGFYRKKRLKKKLKFWKK